MKRLKSKVGVKVVASFVTLAAIVGILYLCEIWAMRYTQEYVAGTGNIKGNVDIEAFGRQGPEFEIGANAFGYAVFKHPKKAFQKLERNYSDGITLIRKEFQLEPLSQKSYD